MAQFQVPQFIETEDKIVGPLTLKQFLYLAAAGLISFLLFFVLKLFFWVIIAAILGTIAAALAFIKYNGRPLPTILGYALQYSLRPKLYLWKQTGEVAQPIPEVSASPLKAVWLKITTAVKPAPAASGPKEQKEKLELYKKTFIGQQIARRVDYR